MPVFDSALQKVSFKKGWRTTESSRKVLVSGVKNWLLERKGWADPRLCREMSTFIVNKNRKPEAKSGCNDDEVLAFGISIQVDLIAPEVEASEEQVRREDGLPVEVFKPHKEKVLSLEKRCLQTVLRKNQEKLEVRQHGYSESLNDIALDGYGWGIDDVNLRRGRVA